MENHFGYLEIFHSSNWQQASFEKRMDALQTLENDYAQRQGREPCPVYPKKYENPYQGGQFNSFDEEIYVNEDLVKGTHTEFKNIENYLLVNTVLHEGRHAFQNEAIFEVEMGHRSATAEVEKWMQNEEAYFRQGFMYYLQPLERDAHSFGHGEAGKIFMKLEKKLGPNENYMEYMRGIWAEKDHTIDAAKKLYGENYLYKIDEHVRNEYMEITGQKQLNKENSIKKDSQLNKNTGNELIKESAHKQLKSYDNSKKKAHPFKGKRDLLSEVKGERKLPPLRVSHRKSGKGRSTQ